MTRWTIEMDTGHYARTWAALTRAMHRAGLYFQTGVVPEHKPVTLDALARSAAVVRAAQTAVWKRLYDGETALREAARPRDRDRLLYADFDGRRFAARDPLDGRERFAWVLTHQIAAVNAAFHVHDVCTLLCEAGLIEYRPAHEYCGIDDGRIFIPVAWLVAVLRDRPMPEDRHATVPVAHAAYVATVKVTTDVVERVARRLNVSFGSDYREIP